MQQAIVDCNETLGYEYEKYVLKVREEIRDLPRGSKEWWRLNRILLGRSVKSGKGIPPLREPSGEWIMENEEKANLFAKTFAAKSTLPEKVGEWKTEVSAARQSSFKLLRCKKTEAILKKIDVDKSTGPDQLPGRVLKACARELALPITMLAKQMLVQGVWPDCWRDHWLAPVYKKGAVAKATNYRGVHLTCILSKALERVISEVFVQFLAESGAYGSSQWAFQKERSCRDLVALATLNWILQLHAGSKVGVFLSDISGAFDRVECKLLLEKWKRPECVANF